MSLRLSLLAVLVLALPAQAQSPVLDQGYGDGGFAQDFAAVPAFNLDAVRYALRDDGSVYYAAVEFSSALGGSQVGLIDADGDGDSSFGTQGRYRLPQLEGTPDPANELAADLIEDSRGHAVVAGTSWSPLGGEGSSFAPFLLRLRPDGTPDPRFRYQRYELERPASATSVVQSGGTYLVGVDFQDGDCGVLAVGPTGEIVTEYGVDGVAALDVGSECDVSDLALDASGRAVVGLSTVLDGDRKAAVIRLNRRGRLDRRFGADGMYLPLPDGESVLRQVVVNVDGRIHTAGYVVGGEAPRGFSARGSRTGREGDRGSLWRWASEPLGASPLLPSGGLVVLPDGSSYLSTLSRDESDRRNVVLAHLTRFGRLDPTFGTGGVYAEPVRPVGGPAPVLEPLDLSYLGRTPSGRLVVGGVTNTNTTSSYDAFLLGYRTEGAPALAMSAASVGQQVPSVTVGPNPARGEVRIQVDAQGSARVRVVDTLGRLVATLHDGPAPSADLRWTPRAGVSGTFLVVVEAEGERRTVPATVLR